MQITETRKTRKEPKHRFEETILRLKICIKSNDRWKVQRRVEKSIFERNIGNSWNFKIA